MLSTLLIISIPALFVNILVYRFTLFDIKPYKLHLIVNYTFDNKFDQKKCHHPQDDKVTEELQNH